MTAGQVPDGQQGVLPYGKTLHFLGCGCSQRHGLRTPDVVDHLVQQTFASYQQGKLLPTRKLTVAYMLPHHNVGFTHTYLNRAFAAVEIAPAAVY